MSKKNHSTSSRWLFNVTFFVLIGLLLLSRMSYGFTEVKSQNQAILKGTISLEPVKALPENDQGKIQPGTGIKLSVTVKNEGQSSNPPGQIFIRYAYANPLHKESGSVIFQTEKKPLPAIEAGKQIQITFDTAHTTTSVPDFVRHDWQLREYQAIAEIQNVDYPIGTLALTFSAYYYPGIKKEFSTKIAPEPAPAPSKEPDN